MRLRRQAAGYGDAVGVTGDLTVRDNAAELRYEVLEDGKVVGEILYRARPGDRIVLLHTEVLPYAEGGGVGSRLVAGALDDIRARGLRVVPLCPFVAGYIRRHPEYADLVADSTAAQS
jgi:predicted GNAT family acetyltransferase